jgi:hypothetical protein
MRARLVAAVQNAKTIPTMIKVSPTQNAPEGILAGTSALKMLRRAVGISCRAGDSAVVARALNCSPQFMQNLVPGCMGAPHRGHIRSRAGALSGTLLEDVIVPDDTTLYEQWKLSRLDAALFDYFAARRTLVAHEPEPHKHHGRRIKDEHEGKQQVEARREAKNVPQRTTGPRARRPA